MRSVRGGPNPSSFTRQSSSSGLICSDISYKSRPWYPKVENQCQDEKHVRFSISSAGRPIRLLPLGDHSVIFVDRLGCKAWLAAITCDRWAVQLRASGAWLPRCWDHEGRIPPTG